MSIEGTERAWKRVKDGVVDKAVEVGGGSVWLTVWDFNWSLAWVILSRSEASILRVSVTGKCAKSNVCIMNADFFGGRTVPVFVRVTFL